MGSASLLAGGIGIMIGLNGMSSTARSGEKASPPWNDGGIQTRVDGLSNNFNVRVIDVSCWGGVGLSALALIGARGPSRMKLNPGVLGVMQAVGLGSAWGSLGAIGCILLSTTMDDEDE